MDGSFISTKPGVCFQVEKIIGISSDGNYQVQWAPAWVSKFHLVGCEQLIQEFLCLQSTKELNDGTDTQLQIPSTVSSKVGDGNVEANIEISQPESIGEISQASMVKIEVTEDVLDSESSRSSLINCFPIPEDAGAPHLKVLSEKEMVKHEYEYRSSQIGADDSSSPPGELLKHHNELEDSDNDMDDSGIYIQTNVYTRASTVSHAKKERHECEQCNKVFTRRNDLKRHYRIHTGEELLYCTYCDKAFTRKHYLEQHVRIHTGEKPYPCSLCDAKFTQSGQLNAHLRTHKGVKPYTCDVCGKKFTRKNSLTYHIRTHTCAETVS